MDWNRVFDETGEEEGEWQEDADTTTRTGILQQLEHYSPFICYCFTVNYILGVGCLGVPYAFQKSGIVQASLVMIVISFVSYLTVLFVAEASYRGLQIKIDKATNNPFKSPKVTATRVNNVTRPIVINNATTISASNYGSVLKLSNMKLSPATSSGTINNYSLAAPSSSTAGYRERETRTTVVKSIESADEDKHDDDDVHREVELTTLTSEFLGKPGKRIFQISVMGLSYIGLLAYTQVFNASFHSQICFECDGYIPVILFSVIVVPLSLLDLNEQITVQFLMSFLRFLSLGLLIFGTILAIFTTDQTLVVSTGGKNDNEQQQRLLQHIHIKRPVLVNYDNFGMIFTTSIFAQLFQHSVPGLIRPLAVEYKKNVKSVFFYAILTTTLIYLVMGITCSLYFGDDIAESINLNFVGFTWGFSNDSPFYVIINICSMIIVLFPALDTLSVFPLIANTLGNSLNASFPRAKKHVRVFLNMSTESFKKHKIERYIVLFWRLVASIPPIILSFYVKDLSFSMQLAGIFGIFLALVIPSLLQLYSQKHYSSPHNIAYQITPYSTYFSQTYTSSYIILFIAFIALTICLCQIFKIT